MNVTTNRHLISSDTFTGASVVKLLLSITLLLQVAVAAGQSMEDLLADGLSFEKQFRTEEALERYERIISEDPNHTQALTHASRMMSNIGGRFPMDQRDLKRPYYDKARAYASRAIELNPESADARLAHIISLGLLSEISRSPREKVADAKLIYAEAKAILGLDPEFPEAYFVLGKWQLELSRLNWFELFAVRLLFGGLPEDISKQAALDYFNKAIAINPHSILFLYGVASAYADLGDKSKARQHLEKAIALPLADPDDAQRKERCRQLLRTIQKTGQ